MRTANKTGTDLVTGFTKNEQAVIDKEVENRVAQEEEGGKKLSNKDKTAIYEQVVRDMEKGYISTDTIESVLGKDALTQYDALSKEAEEFKTLYETEGGKLTEKQKDRLAELKEKNKANPYEELLKSERAKISRDVRKLAKNDRLAESYNERTRSGQKFQADVSKYSEAQRKTVQNAIDSGILNNTNRAHEFVDLVAKISADKGISFGFADNEKLKASGFALDGVLVNGFVNENGVTINVQSAKALNRVVGHEITHVLEGTELYNALQSAVTEYAKTKKEYSRRLKELTQLYEGKNANVEQELVADLVGDYLFTDADFIKHLSTEHRNLAQKIYDEIKYLCKIATAGTKEARQLEKVKKAFADAYRAETKNPTADGGVRYSVSSQYDYSKPFAEQIKDFQNGQFNGDDTLMVGATPDVLKQIGLLSLPMTINQKHINDALNGTYKGTSQEKLDHTFTPQELATLPEKLADPVAVIYDKRTGKANASESNIDVFVEMSVASGKQVLVAVQVNGNGHINGIRVDSNKVATVHGNTDSAARLIDAINEHQKGNVSVFYINNDKTTKVLQSTGNPIPSGLSNLDGFIHSITDPGSPVKMRLSSVTESQQFKRWFGDWQNHPENASKVVNADGTPKVVYHGSTEEFTAFSYGHIGSATGVGILGDGFYFTDKKRLAKNYGKNVLPVYLQMKNPYIATESDAYKLRTEDIRQQGFDGVILRAPQGDVYMVFENTQIKSATDNIGTFDGNNPDIRYSLSKKDFSIAPPVGADVYGKDIGYDIAPPIPESVLRENGTGNNLPKVGEPGYAPMPEGYVQPVNTTQSEESGIREQLRSSQDTLNAMVPVANITTPSSFAEMDLEEKKNWVIEKLRPTGYAVERKGFGIIDFAQKKLRSAFNYFKKGSAEEAAFEAMPYVLKKGVEISSRENHKGRKYSTVTFAAPVTINGQRGNMAVVVRQTEGNQYKVHRILSPDGSVFNLSEIQTEAESSTTRGVADTGSLASSKDSASINSIPESRAVVNPEDSTGAAPSGFDPVSHLQYEYGSLPEGERPVREDSLPKSTNGKDKVSLTARTVKGAEATPDALVDLLDKTVVEGGLSYIPLTNDATVQRVLEQKSENVKNSWCIFG